MRYSLTGILVAWLATPAFAQTRPADGDGSVAVGGELKRWHAVTFTVDGPFAAETGTRPNPFTDYRLTLTVRHSSGSPSYAVPGYFAADGNAGETSADAGTKWRAHFCPDKTGEWSYAVDFVTAPDAAVADDPTGRPVAGHGKVGTFAVADTDKAAPDFRARGRLEYVGRRYLRFAGTGDYFLKLGADSPETLLAYSDIDGTEPGRKATPNHALKTWQPHARDWAAGDPTWRGGKGKGLIGALNYLSAKGVNGISFLTYNAGGDGDNVWPFVARGDKLHYDCSKLDQWGVVFDHAQARGLFLHFKLQENENDDDRIGGGADDKMKAGRVPESLDGGRLGVERKLYLRELIARYGHHLALNWNLGEENTQSPEEQRQMTKYVTDTDPYPHPVVVHTFIPAQDKVYTPLLGAGSGLHGASLQNMWNVTHQRTLKWVRESERAGRPWVVCNDEQGSAALGVPPDEGYTGFDGVARGDKVQPARQVTRAYTRHDVRRYTLWGNLTAGGAGVEYYFGYQLPQNDLVCEDYRSREKSWQSGRHALAFFRDNNLPVVEMANADELVGNPTNENGTTCLAKPGSVYVIARPTAGAVALDLTKHPGEFGVRWFDPRNGGELKAGSVASVSGGRTVELGTPPDSADEDWVILVRKAGGGAK